EVLHEGAEDAPIDGGDDRLTVDRDACLGHSCPFLVADSLGGFREGTSGVQRPGRVFASACCGSSCASRRSMRRTQITSGSETPTSGRSTESTAKIAAQAISTMITPAPVIGEASVTVTA